MRNNSLDALRVVAFCCVVSLHTVTPDGPFSITLNVLARFAVPFFFAIAGFFSLGVSIETILRRIRHVAFLCILGILIYAFAALLTWTPSWSDLAMLGGGWGQLIKNFILWNDFPAAYPLWFLFAMLYVYACYAVVVRWRLPIAAFVGGGVALFGARALLVECAAVIAPLGMQVRSWLLSGLPYFCLGLVLRRCEARLKRAPWLHIAVLGIAGCVLSMLECAFFGLQEGYVGTVGIVVACFACCVAHPLSSIGSNAVVQALRGGDVCLVAYLIHYAVLSALDQLSLVSGFSFLGTAEALRLVVTAVVSMALGVAISHRSGSWPYRRPAPPRRKP